MDVEPGRYKVSLMIPGRSPEDVGSIEVTAASQPGTLNEFLTRVKSGVLTPDVMAVFETLSAQVVQNTQQVAEDRRLTDISRNAAKTSEDNAKTSETASAGSQAAAKTSAENAKTSETAAAGSKTAAKASETSAGQSATSATGSQAAAKTSADNAKASETSAAGSKTAAESAASEAATTASNAAKLLIEPEVKKATDAATAAHTSETNAYASEQAAAQHATDAQGVAAGTGRLIAFKKIEVSGDYVPSPGTKFIIFEAVGAGGSGTTLNATHSWIYTPGGDGGYVKWMDSDVQPLYSIMIGAPSPGALGGLTRITLPGIGKINLWGGNGSEGAIFPSAEPSEPKQIGMSYSDGFDTPLPLLLLEHTRSLLEITYLVSKPDGTHRTGMVMEGGEGALGYKTMVRDITEASSYVASTGYGAGSPGYWPGVTGVVDESVMLGRPGVVFAWEYS